MEVHFSCYEDARVGVKAVNRLNFLTKLSRARWAGEKKHLLAVAFFLAVHVENPRIYFFVNVFVVVVVSVLLQYIDYISRGGRKGEYTAYYICYS